MFNAILLKQQDGKTHANVVGLEELALPEGDVSIAVEFSTINYKDALAMTGKSPVVRQFPMVPGIDLAGTVSNSSNSGFQVGDAVLLNGWGVGETHWGGLAQAARVKGNWLLKRPSGLDAWRAMALGTAGYTAMLCVLALEAEGIRPDHGEVLVTGASGGVGSVALFLLAKRGFRVVAVTGRVSESAYLKNLGATEVLDRSVFANPGKPLSKERWAAAVDCVGSHTLANVCAATQYGGVVAACGLAQGMDFPGTVAPFILRSIRLIGIDSVYAAHELRVNAWDHLAKEVPLEILKEISQTIPLAAAPSVASQLLEGKVRGRVVVDVCR